MHSFTNPLRLRRRLAPISATFALLVLAGTASAVPLTGTHSIPGSYPTLAAAITDLNVQGVGAGGVTLDLLAGNPETAPAGGYVVGGAGSLVLTTSSAANPITIQGNGNVITAPTPQAAGALNDAIFKLIGADWVTITGFTMNENAANLVNTPAGSNNMTEWGVALLYVTTADGSQNNTIQGNTITLNRVYANTWGVYSNVRHSPTAVTSLVDIVNGTTAPNSANRVYGNTISNVMMGIAFIGSGTAANQDSGNDVGGASAATGNIISNWGGAAALSGYISNTGTSYCIYMNHQRGENVSFNTLTSAAVSGTAVTFRAVFKDYTTVGPTGTFACNYNNNTMTMTSGFTSGTFEGIRSQGMGTLSTATININGNTMLNCAVTSNPSSSTILCFGNSSSAGTVSMSNNTVQGSTSAASTGGFTFISSTGTATSGSTTLNNNLCGTNTIAAITFNNITSGAINGIISSAGAAGSTLSISGNNINQIAQMVPGSGAHTYISNTSTGPSTTIDSNNFALVAVNTSGSVTMISNNVTHAAGSTHSVSSNSIVGSFAKIAAGGTLRFYDAFGSSPSTVTETNTLNNFSNVTCVGATTIGGWRSADGSTPGSRKTVTNNTFSSIFTGAAPITVLTVGFSDNTFASNNVTGNVISSISSGDNVTGITSSSGNQNFSNNSLSILWSTGASGLVVGLSITGGTTQNVSNNTISSLAGDGGVSPSATGILVSSGTTVNVSKNKIYDLVESGPVSVTPPAVVGLNMTGGTTVNAFNNLIGDLRATAANMGPDAIVGMRVNSSTASSSYNLSFNSVHLNAASSGLLFSTSGIFHLANATATTGALTLRDNIVVNESTPSGAGIISAFRRNGTALGNYGSASNNNLLYAGAPAANRLIYYDGTNSDQLLPAFKTRVSPRDGASVTELPPFLSTSGASSTFLHIDPSLATQVESGGTPVAGIADDYDGDGRNALTPDIGADEGLFTLADLSGPAITYAPLGNSPNTGTNPFTNVTVTDASGVDGSPGTRPRVYYKRSTDLETFNDNTSGTAGWKFAEANGGSSPFDFTIDYSRIFGGTVGAGDVIQYFVVAQDLAGPPNVAINSGTFASAPASVALAAAQFPIGGTVNSYTIVGTIGGTFTVGAAGNYLTLTAAIADLNLKFQIAPVTFLLIDPTYTTPAETFPITVNQNPGASAANTLTIKPDVGVTAAITGSSASALIVLNGTDYVKIDGSNNGSSSRDLTLTNTSAATTSAVIWGQTGSGPNPIIETEMLSMNLVGSGSTQTLIGAGYGSSTIGLTNGTNNNNNRIRNCDVSKVQIGLYSGGASAANKNTGTQIRDNRINATTPDNISIAGIIVRFENGPIIDGNRIGQLSRSTAGTVVGVSLGVTAGANLLTATTGDEVVNAEVTHNEINSVVSTNATGYTAAGILVAPATSGTTKISNNMISGISSPATPSDATLGIMLLGGTGSTTQVHFNSVYLTGARGAGATNPSYALAISGTDPVVDARNNILDNEQTSAGGGKSYAVGLSYASFANLVSNYNDLYVAGANGVLGITGGFTAGTDRPNLLAWQGATGKDANSISASPLFVSSSNPHINNTGLPVSPVSNIGQVIAGITDDFDLEAGNRGTTPDIGADEFVTYTLSATASTGGSVGVVPSQPEYNPGTSVTITPTADPCYVFDHWSGDASGNANPLVVTMDANKNIVANFVPITYTIVASAGAGGSISPSGNVSVACGTDQKFDVLADSCHTIADVLVDGVSVGPTASYTFTNVQGAHTISATFNAVSYVITASAGVGGSISPSGPVNVACGGSQKFDVIPDPCYAIADVLVDGVSVGATASYTFSGVSANHTIVASFAPTSYTVVASAGAGGSISPTGIVAVACGADQKFDVVADPCFHILDVLVDGVSVGVTASYTFTNVQGNHTISATFAPTTYTIVASAGTGGSISPSGSVSVACGADQKFDILADPCYHILDVLVDGVSVGVTSSYTFTNVQAGHTISATFAPTTYIIVASAGTGGSISPSGSVSVACGADQKFDVIADPCYHILDVLVDGVSVGPTASYTFTNVQAGHTISATFAPTTYVIAASAGTGGSISPSGNVVVGCGADQKFDITPLACYQILDVLVDGVSVGPTASYTFSAVSANHTIHATFAPTTYVIAATAGTGGSIAPSGNVVVGCGVDQKFDITPLACYHILDVLVDGVSVGPTASYTFSAVSANHTIHATFAPTTYVIAATAGAGGSIAPTGNVVVACGANQKFDITPDACYQILDVVVDGNSVGPTTSYTFTNVQGNHTIHATFAQTTYVIVASAGPNGQISPSGNVNVPCGADQKFDVTPDPGYGILDVIVDGNSVGPTASYTFTNVQANHTIHATFVDATDPLCSVVGPNGGETFIIGVPAKLSWSASDNVGVTCVDLYLSRNGFGGPWETIALCVPNTGTYTWLVTGPQTTNAVFQIRVLDAAGNECVDMSAAPFTILDFTTPALSTEILAEPADGGIALTFQLPTPELFNSVHFERAELADGPWTVLDITTLVTDQSVRVVDVTAEPGREYRYRLMGTTWEGQIVSLATTTGTIPIVRFELSPAAPNPTRGASHVFLSLPKAGRASLAVFDIRGREIAVLAQGEFAAGRREYVWNAQGAGGRVTPGVYFVRATWGKETAIQRVIVAR